MPVMSAPLARSLARIPPGSWAVAMGCGIVSIDLLTIGRSIASAVLLWFAVSVWLVLALRLLSSAERLRSEPRSVAILGSVAATAVLGARFAAQGDRLVSAVLLGLAAASFALLAVPVLRYWLRPATGTSFLLSVALQGLAVLLVTVAASYHARGCWLSRADECGGPGQLAAVVAWQFDWREVTTGAGDHWVAGGALAISTLAAGKITARGGVGAAALGRAVRGGTAGSLNDYRALVPRDGLPRRSRRRRTSPAQAQLRCPPLGDGLPGRHVRGLHLYHRSAHRDNRITDFAKAWTLVAAAVTLIVLAGLRAVGPGG